MALPQKWAILVRRLNGESKRAFLEAIKTAKGRSSVTLMIKAIETGDMGAAMIAAGMREGMWSQLVEVLRNAYYEGGVFAMTTTVPKKFGLEFNLAHPRAEEWLRRRSTTLVQTDLFPEQLKSIQVMMSDGMARGANPRTTALDIVGRISKQTGRRTGGVIGLTGTQSSYVTNMANDLDEMNWSRYRKRTLRDRRYDKMVKASFKSGKPLPADVRHRLISGYEDRMLRHRGETISRTETLRALNEANDEALRQVVDSKLAPSNAISKIWRHSFGKDERPGHLSLSGESRRLDEAFTNPITGAVMKYPGDGPAGEIINCRCYIENDVDFIGAELAGGFNAGGGFGG